MDESLAYCGSPFCQLCRGVGVAPEKEKKVSESIDLNLVRKLVAKAVTALEEGFDYDNVDATRVLTLLELVQEELGDE